MQSQPKVILITGAGSTVGYGFPTGNQLKHQIINLCESANYESNVPSIVDTTMNRHLPFGKEPKELNEFAQRLRKSDHTIDAFCYEENDSNTTELSKILIGYILQKATKKYIAGDQFEEDWLKRLIGIVTSFVKTDSLKVGNLSFITFNYDCVIEYKIEEAINRYTQLNNEGFVEFFKSITIDHVYGKLDNQLPPNGGLDRLRDYSSDILLMREGKSVLSSQNFKEKYYSIFENSVFVLFLGFGFDLLNLEAIGLPSVLDENRLGRPNISKIFGTTSKVSEINLLSIYKSRFPKLQNIDPNISCVGLINKWGDSIRSQLQAK